MKTKTMGNLKSSSYTNHKEKMPNSKMNQINFCKSYCDRLKRYVFKYFLNISTLSACFTQGGKELYSFGPITLKALKPCLELTFGSESCNECP